MAKVEVWRCDGCGKVLENKRDVYRIKLETLPFYVIGDPEARPETLNIDLDFCYVCAKDLLETLKDIAKRREVR